MKKINILVVLVFCTVSLFAQFASNWQVDFQDSPTLNYSNEGRKVITDANSNIFVLGDYSSDRDSAGHTTGTTQYTVRLQKYNYNGVLQTWVYIPVNGLITNGFDNRNSFGLELDASGNVYIGYSVYNNSGDFDLVIRKYSNTLTLKWTYVYATSNQDVGVDLKLNGTTAYAIVKSYAGANT